MHRLLIPLILVSSISAAEPIALSDIPHRGLREQIAALPQEPQRAALHLLSQSPQFLADSDHLRVSPDGSMYSVDSATVAAPPVAAAAFAPRAAIARASVPISSTSAYAHSSRPGSSRTLYLDFNGHVVSGTAWNLVPAFGPTPIWDATPYSLDGDFANFSDAEQDAIYLIWQRVAEDFRIFDINVTTVEPATFDFQTGRVLITRSLDAAGIPCPFDSAIDAGGLAYINAFGTANYATLYSPAWCYYDKLSGGREDAVAECVSHQFGHNLGLNHHGPGAAGAYPGHGPPGFDWAPIMGESFGKVMTQWCTGEYDTANNIAQDDLAIIASKLTTIADDVPDTLIAAPSLTASGTPTRTVAPFNGIINSANDIDMFTFSSNSGGVSFTISPQFVTSLGFLTPATPGANLDIRADLLDSTGTPLTGPGLSSDVIDNCVATLSGSLAAPGTYFLRIRGAGNRNPATDGYSTYGSIGQYRVTGTIPPAPPGTISLGNGSLVQDEGSSGPRTITIAVSRSAGAGGATSVAYATSSLSPITAGTDYTSASGTLSWADGDPLTKTFDVTVSGDTTEELDESFVITLSAPTGGATLVFSTQVVVLRNDDGASAALAAASAAAIQPSGTGDSGGCGAGGIAAGFIGLAGLGLLRRRRR